MKKIICIVIAISVFGLLSSFKTKIHSGGEIGNTGAPGEGTCSGCHGGGAAGTTVSITAVPDFSANVFDPSLTYTITVSVGHPSLTRFGFNCEVLGASNTNAGVMANGGPGLAFFNLGASKKSATHTAPKVGIGSASWTFEWTPPLGGNATIYVSGNAVNFDGSTSGDRSISTSLALATVPTKVSENSQQQISKINLFPNPAQDITSISYYLSSTQKVTIELMDITGKIIKTFVNENYEAGPHSSILDLKGIQSGVYFVKTSLNGEKISQKLISVM